nr:HDOD domain-containing protein [Dissulfurirhabdus thermomarina]
MTLERVFDTLTEVPTFPEVVQKALALLDDPMATMADVEELLRYDQAITANILRVTNSAHFGLPQQVSNLQTALALLGTDQIRQILMVSASLPYLSRPLNGYGLTARELWAHAIGCAVTAEILAGELGHGEPSLPFTAALLHDLGKIVLDLHLGIRLEEIRLLVERERLPFDEAEWRVLGADHAVIGYELLHQWNFPPGICRAVRNHHDPDLYVQDDLSAIMALSNILAVSLGMGVHGDSFRYRIAPDLAERLGLSGESLDRCIARSLDAFYAARDLVGLVPA